MKNKTLRIVLGGVISVAVLLALALVWTRAIELLNSRSDVGFALGIALFVAAFGGSLALVYFGVRGLLTVTMREEEVPKTNNGGEPRALCEELFGERSEETRECSLERKGNER